MTNNDNPKRIMIEPWNIFGDNSKESRPSEIYLLEWLNASKHFGTHFEYVDPQNNGEPDIRGDNGYELDFKLFLSTSEGKSRKELMRNHKANFFDYYDLGEVIRDKSVEELENIENMTEPNKKYNADKIAIVKHFLKKCRTNKNLLFFAPRYFFAEITEEVLKYFNDVVANALEYREKHVKKDTYFGWIQCFESGCAQKGREEDGKFVLAKYNTERDRLEVVDMIGVSESRYFLRHDKKE